MFPFNYQSLMVYVHIILQGNGIDKLVTQEND